MRAGHQEALGRIKDLLWLEWDPIDLRDVPGAPRDEYDSYAPEVLARARRAATGEVAAYLGWVRVDQMCLPPEPDADLAVAERSVALVDPSDRAPPPARATP